MEKLEQAGEGGGSGPPPFTLSTIKCKDVVYAPAERAETFHLFLLYPYIYSVCALQLVHTDSMMYSYINKEEMYTVKKG
jgi:hypothetical protein